MQAGLILVIAASAIGASAVAIRDQRRAAQFLIRLAGAIYRPRRQEFEGELGMLHTLPDESGLGYAFGTVVGATVERATSASKPLRVRSVSKSFGTTQALSNVSLDVPPGCITALLGRNGAGKTTLLTMIAGERNADHGSIRFGDTAIQASGTQREIATVVSQDLQLFPDLTVAQNIALGAKRPGHWLINQALEHRSASALLRHLGSNLQPSRRVCELTLPDQVIVAIARAVEQGCQLLVLDEPTAGLPPEGIQQVHVALQALRQQGVGVIFVSHRIDDVFQIADRVAVLREGRLVHDSAIESTSPDEVVRHIVGDSIAA